TLGGRGFSFGLHQGALDPFDPFERGFALTDVWGPSSGSIG
ncbi:MAG: proline racemase, partial [Allorhizobium sp.]